MRGQRRRRTGAPSGQHLIAVAVGVLLATGGLAAVGSGGPPTPLDRAAAAQARPNVLVIESDDQAVESMRAMSNVNSLIGDQGATFTNSFVNYSLCCPSRSTFLTGQYAHNHGVLGNSPPNGGFQRFQALHGDNNLAVWLQDAGYYTAPDRQVPERLRQRAGRSAGMVRVARGLARHPGRLRLHAQQRRHPGHLRPRCGRLQAGRARPGRRSTSSTAGRPSRSRSSCGSPTRHPRRAARTRTRSPPTTARTRPSPPRATPMPSTLSPCRSRPSFNEADVSDKPAAIQRRPR